MSIESRDLVKVTTDEHILTIELDRQENYNTLNRQTLVELLDVVEEASADPSVRVVVLTGRGRAFSAGGDLSAGLLEVNGPPPLQSQGRRLREFERIVELLHRGNFVSIAAINGACAGAGMSLAMACDMRISSENAAFNTGFLTAGVSGDFGAIWFVTKIAGPAVARRLFLRPGKFMAADALEYGLVDQTVPGDQLMAEVKTLAEELSARAPLALKAMKSNLSDAEQMPLGAYLDVEALRHATCVASEDASEAASSFMERRDPVFIGK